MSKLRDWWAKTKTARDIIVCVLILALIAIFGYVQYVKQDCRDLCKAEGFDSGEGFHAECKCITYTPYAGEW